MYVIFYYLRNYKILYKIFPTLKKIQSKNTILLIDSNDYFNNLCPFIPYRNMISLISIKWRILTLHYFFKSVRKYFD